MQTETRKPGRPKGLKIDWNQISAKDWLYMPNRAIAEKVGTSVPNVHRKRASREAVGAPKFRGKPPAKGRPPIKKA